MPLNMTGLKNEQAQAFPNPRGAFGEQLAASQSGHPSCILAPSGVRGCVARDSIPLELVARIRCGQSPLYLGERPRFPQRCFARSFVCPSRSRLGDSIPAWHSHWSIRSRPHSGMCSCLCLRRILRFRSLARQWGVRLPFRRGLRGQIHCFAAHTEAHDIRMRGFAGLVVWSEAAYPTGPLPEVRLRPDRQRQREVSGVWRVDSGWG